MKIAFLVFKIDLNTNIFAFVINEDIFGCDDKVIFMLFLQAQQFLPNFLYKFIEKGVDSFIVFDSIDVSEGFEDGGVLFQIEAIFDLGLFVPSYK